MGRGAVDAETRREKESWRRTAWLAAQLINISGKTLPKGRTVRVSDLIRFEDEGKRGREIDMERRRREAEETFRQHKQKFWTKIKGASVEDVKCEPYVAKDEPDDPAAKIMRFIESK